MSGAFIFLMVLVAATPLVALFDGPLLDSAITAIVAVTLIIVAGALPSGEARHQFRSIRFQLLFLVIPGLWMALQAIPIPLRSLANPAWQSAAAGLGVPLIGSITVDTGRTVLALVYYLTVLGLIAASSAISINRSRAATVLVVLVVATTAMALLLIAGTILAETSPTVQESLQGASALGIVASAAAIIRGFDQYQTHGTKFELSQFVRTESGYFAAHVICWVAVVIFAPIQVTFAAGFGFAIAIVIALSRLAVAGHWAILTFAGLVLVAILGIAAIRFAGQGDLTVRYASAPAVEVATAARIRENTGWQGSGAGTFSALLPVYEEAGQPPTSAPTTAAAWAIELGTPTLGLIMIFSLTSLALFVRGALRRGRDSCYPALGASSVAVLLIEGFVDSSAIRTSVAIVAATIGGLALAQIVSRSLTTQ